MHPTDPVTPTEGLIFTISRLLKGIRHGAVGASSPIPGAGVLLTRALAERSGAPRVHVSILGSRRHNSFTNGGVEIFDLAGQGRVDAFFLGGGQIDGQANINLVGVGDYPTHDVRWPGSFGSAYLYHLIPRMILFREEHTRRVMVPRVDFVSAAGPRADVPDYRPGGPHALLTRLCLFSFDKQARRFQLQSVHPGHTVEEVRDQTGFDFDCPDEVPVTPMPDAPTLALIRSRIREEISETYPKFAAQMWPS
ncbi:MAG: CoA synthetase [Burkholderiaceae bacterium]|nr:CoA synthetase [Burkholderiaceae bacterium]